MRRHSLFLGLMSLAATLAVAATANADWFNLRGLRDDYGVAILSPVETGPPPERTFIGALCHRHGVYTPYYSPLAPISVRWLPDMRRQDFCVHYYPGYWPSSERGINGCAANPGLGGVGSRAAGVSDYGPYSGAPRDEQSLLRLGGNGPEGPYHNGAVDIIDMIQGNRAPAGGCRP